MAEVKRKLMHSRQINSLGYLREDGLWDIEARMTDIKSYDVDRDFDQSRLPKGMPFHDISVKLTLDDSFLIKAIKVEMDSFPFPSCGGAVPSFEQIQGSRIGPGWNRWVKQTFDGKVGCTHVLELMPVVATTAFQTMWQPLGKKYPQAVPAALINLVNTCHGWSEEGPMVKKLVEEQVIRLPQKEISS